MANFCTRCGNPIQFCTCQAAPQTQQTNVPKDPVPPFINPTGSTYGYNPVPTPPPSSPVSASNQKSSEGNGSVVNVNLNSDMLVPIKNFFGFGESEMIDNSDPYERGKKIVPDLVAPCEGEIPVKQYEIGKCRARLRLQWSEARMQVTNKRVLFRVSGRSAIGKDVSNHDYKIDEISGVNFAKGIQFSFLTFLLGFLFMAVSAGVGFLLGCIPGVSVIMLFVLLLASMAMPIVFRIILNKKLHIVCGMIATMAIGNVFGSETQSSCFGYRTGNDFLAVIAVIVLVVCGITAIYQLIKFSLKPSASIEIVTKDAGKSVFGLFSGRIFRGNVGLDEIVPAKDTDEAFKEMSAIISDIQQLGDYGVQKWKEGN